MEKLRIEKPIEPNARKPLVKFLPLALLLLIAGALAGFLLFAFSRPAPAVPSFEIPSFGAQVEIYDAATQSWQRPERGDFFEAGQRMKTGETGEAELKIPGVLTVRLKPGSELSFEAPGAFSRKSAFPLKLDRGEMLIATEKGFQGKTLAIDTPHLIVESGGGYFSIRTGSEAEGARAGVLRGGVRAKSKVHGQGSWRDVKGLEIVEVSPEKGFEAPRRVSQEEWNHLREIYELTVRSAANEAAQLDLSKEAGSLFEYVFDHGSFYTPQFGYGAREFYRTETGEVLLETEYDVFPKGSFVGTYIKTRDLDLSKFSRLEFEMRRSPEEGYPQMVRIELKSKSGVVRAFAAKQPQVRWGSYSFPLHVKQPTDLTEIALVFLHDRVGEYKKGAVQFRNIHIVPADADSRPGDSS